jgi:large subunit ribosomal protein L29
MDAQDLRSKSVDELNAELVALRSEQFKLRMQQATGELNRHTDHGRVRKDIARIKTVLNELKPSSPKRKKSGKKK